MCHLEHRPARSAQFVRIVQAASENVFPVRCPCLCLNCESVSHITSFFSGSFSTAQTTELNSIWLDFGLMLLKRKRSSRSTTAWFINWMPNPKSKGALTTPKPVYGQICGKNPRKNHLARLRPSLRWNWQRSLTPIVLLFYIWEHWFFRYAFALLFTKFWFLIWSSLHISRTRQFKFSLGMFGKKPFNERIRRWSNIEVWHTLILSSVLGSWLSYRSCVWIPTSFY